MKTICALLLLMVAFSSCRETWTIGGKNSFYQACTETARSDWAQSDSVAKTYCDCVFEKMKQKYPHEEDALEHIDVLAKDTDLVKCKQEIMKK